MDIFGACPSSMDLKVSTPICNRRNSTHISRKTSWGTPIPPSSQRGSPPLEGNLLDDVNLDNQVLKGGDNDENWNTLDNITALGLSFNPDEPEISDTTPFERFSLDEPDNVFADRSLPIELMDRPFSKWVKNLQRTGTPRRKTLSGDMDTTALERKFFESPGTRRRIDHKKSSSGSSFGFVTAVKSASISLASFSIAPHSRRTAMSSRHQRTDRSSKASNIGRLSEDSSYLARSVVIDQAVMNRSLHRRRVLEELINTEEGYVGDVKFLMNVYVTLLASIPSLSLSLRASINRNLNEIVELHEELLGDLHRAVPHSEYTQLPHPPSTTPSAPTGHQRWRSLDAVLENAGGKIWLPKLPGMTAEPKVAAAVARVFGKKMNRFFLYEEYGAKYELMIRDVASAYRTIPQWEVYQKGLEALASSLSSINSQLDGSRKALTIGDLLVKPIQRVCKYPLLFVELLKQTPVCDCPDSHIEIENVLIRLREATTEINRATNDPRMKITMEKTWLLQDRLMFIDMPDARSTSWIRALGHIHLCGVLHVSWQTKESVEGQYLICLLYRDFLLLASSAKAGQIYTVQACIGLSELRVENIDNGRGLQCHTAPFSWKLVFECDHQLFEITMSACSPKEELEWRSRLADRSYKDSLDAGEQAVFTSLSLNIKPLGAVFGKPGTIARRISIHRATTVGSIAGLCQVIIKNTNSIKETAPTVSINRSQSLLMTNRVPVLAPPRGDRVRLETLLADVWTREILPYPGMTSKARGDHLVRASASSMMRKLSVASIASNFTKRSGSMASLQMTAEDNESSRIELSKTSNGLDRNTSDYNLVDIEEPCQSRLSVIQDGQELAVRDEAADNLSALKQGSSSPAGTMRRLATLQVKKSWAHDGQKIITPPLRTSSANSVNQNRATSLSTVTDLQGEEKENVPQRTTSQPSIVSEKPSKKGKGMVMNRAAVAEGIRNLFR